MTNELFSITGRNAVLTEVHTDLLATFNFAAQQNYNGQNNADLIILAKEIRKYEEVMKKQQDQATPSLAKNPVLAQVENALLQGFKAALNNDFLQAVALAKEIRKYEKALQL